ncbi:MAG: glycosyltransferase [Pseudomonadota bacterium]|jgi:spore maturation protein CgeB
MRILVAGDWHSDLHEQAVADALEALGHEVTRFAWHHYFGPPRSARGAAIGRDRPRTATLLQRLQNRYLSGPLVGRLNRDLLALAASTRPELVLVYRGTHVRPGTLRALARMHPRPVLLGYNNDDPFGPGQPRSMWRHFLASLPHYDAVLAYRHRNLDEYRAAGARRVRLLRSWFIPARNHPVSLDAADHERYDCDVVFIGHHEDDGRAASLAAAAEAGFRLRLFGHGYEWDPVLARHPALSALAPVRQAWGEEYNKALCGAKIALCFLSRLNRDTYTRRCFEIPATGTLMLSERTADLESMFRPGVEADYFDDPASLLAQLRRYLDDDALRTRVAAAGRARVVADGHDVASRMRDLLDWVETWRSSVTGAIP